MTALVFTPKRGRAEEGAQNSTAMTFSPTRFQAISPLASTPSQLSPLKRFRTASWLKVQQLQQSLPLLGLLTIAVAAFELVRSSHHYNQSAQYLPCPPRLASNEVETPQHPSPSVNGSFLLHTLRFAMGGANGTCINLQERHLYYPDSHSLPSPALLNTLRDYEKMHQKCVMGVSDWPAHFVQPQPGLEHCRYLVWQDPPDVGLGNRFNALLAAFEYALVTNRALLLNTNENLHELLCNPLEGSSIWTPLDFPLESLARSPHTEEFLEQISRDPYAKVPAMEVLLETRTVSKDSAVFFCQKTQELLQQVTWISWNSNHYTGTGLFLVPAFAQRLLELFPDHVMHQHLARYILNPVNPVWRRVTRAHTTYMCPGSRHVGIQVRTFMGYNETRSKRVLDCIEQMRALPAPVSWEESENVRTTHGVHVAVDPRSRQPASLFTVLVVSLDGGYYKDVRKAYFEGPTMGDSRVAVFTMSDNEHEVHSREANHEAMVEIWLLSLMDTLFFSDRSTFGQIASALRGEKPVYHMNLYPDWMATGDGAFCQRGLSSNLCYQEWPHQPACPQEEALRDQTAFSPPYLRPCQEHSGGKQLVNPKY